MMMILNTAQSRAKKRKKAKRKRKRTRRKKRKITNHIFNLETMEVSERMLKI